MAIYSINAQTLESTHSIDVDPKSEGEIMLHVHVGYTELHADNRKRVASVYLSLQLLWQSEELSASDALLHDHPSDGDHS